MIRKTQVALALALASCAGATLAAGSTTSTLNVSTTVANNCIVSTGATLAFPNYDPVAANASTALAGSGSLTLQCTKNAGANGQPAVLVALGQGGHAVAGQRKMIASVTGDLLNYNLFQPAGVSLPGTCPGTTPWGDGTTGGTALTVPAAYFTTGTAAATPIPVCGTIPGAQDVSAGSYSDSVTITVTF